MQQCWRCMPAPRKRCTCGLLQQAACYGTLRRHSLAALYPLWRKPAVWGCGAVRLLHSVCTGHMLGDGRGVLALAGGCEGRLQHITL